MSDPILPLADAVERLSAKTPIGSVLKSSEWASVPIALRERAQFSAGVTSVNLLQTIQDRLSGQVQMQREQLANGKQATFDRSSFIDAIRTIGLEEGLDPADPSKLGTVQDITSIPRLGLIYDTQVGQAAGYARWKLDQNEGALALWPAQRLGASSAHTPRDWRRRWAEAGDACGWRGAIPSEFVALKNSPIWAKLSRFGTPWPPFDFGSTRDLEDVDREEAIRYGLLQENEIPTGGEQDFNEHLQASVAHLDPRNVQSLLHFFGDQVGVSGDSLHWTAQPTPVATAKPYELTQPAPARTAPVVEQMRVVFPGGLEIMPTGGQVIAIPSGSIVTVPRQWSRLDANSALAQIGVRNFHWFSDTQAEVL